MLRETFAYAGGTRDPFNSLINMEKSGPEIADLDLVGIYQDLRDAVEQRRRAAGEGTRQASQAAGRVTSWAARGWRRSATAMWCS